MMLTKVEGPNEFGNKVFTFSGQYAIEVPAKYEVRELIGRGAYGIVCSAVNTETNDMVAVKKIGRLFEDAVDGKRVLREVKLLAFLDHPNILGLKDLPRPSHPESFTDLYVISDLMENDMQALLRSNKVRLKAGHCQYFSLQLLCALQYIHSAKILHRDLKSSNLLTDSECNLKLCDFGLARGCAEKMTNYVVTRWYRPPELLLVCATYDYSVDLWGAGCLAVEMVTGRPLFAGHDYINQINLIVQLLGVPDLQKDLPSGASEQAMNYIRSLPPSKPKTLEEYVPELRRRFDETSFFDSFDETEEGESGASPIPQRTPAEYYRTFSEFVFGMVKYNPKKRLTAKQAVAHPWLADVRGGQTEIEGCESAKTFYWDKDDKNISTAELRQLFLQEIEDFHRRRGNR